MCLICAQCKSYLKLIQYVYEHIESRRVTDTNTLYVYEHIEYVHKHITKEICNQQVVGSNPITSLHKEPHSGSLWKMLIDLKAFSVLKLLANLLINASFSSGEI